MTRTHYCACDRPLVFWDDEGRCTKCGRPTRPTRTRISTNATALAIAEILLGHRRHGDTRRRADSIVIFE